MIEVVDSSGNPFDDVGNRLRNERIPAHADVRRQFGSHLPRVSEIGVDEELVDLIFIRLTLEKAGESSRQEVPHALPRRCARPPELAAIREAREFDDFSKKGAAAHRELMISFHDADVVIDLVRNGVPVRPVLFISSAERTSETETAGDEDYEEREDIMGLKERPPKGNTCARRRAGR